MNRNDTPCALNEELHEEAAGRERSFCVGEDPRGDHARADERGDDYSTATTDPLGKVADDDATNASAGLHENASSAGSRVIKLENALAKGGTEPKEVA